MVTPTLQCRYGFPKAPCRDIHVSEDGVLAPEGPTCTYCRVLTGLASEMAWALPCSCSPDTRTSRVFSKRIHGRTVHSAFGIFTNSHGETISSLTISRQLAMRSHFAKLLLLSTRSQWSHAQFSIVWIRPVASWRRKVCLLTTTPHSAESMSFYLATLLKCLPSSHCDCLVQKPSAQTREAFVRASSTLHAKTKRVGRL